MVTDGRLDINSVDHVLKEKQQIIKKNGLLEYIAQDPSMSDVGGLENIKRWLHKRNHSWMDSASEYSLPAPKVSIASDSYQACDYLYQSLRGNVPVLAD